MSIRSSGWLSAWALMTVSELTAGMNVTCRPRAANKPWCRATKKPAESTAGTTPTFRSGSEMTDGAASPPPATFGRNRIAKTAAATTAPTTSAPRTARMNLRGIDGSSLSGVGKDITGTDEPRTACGLELIRIALITVRCSRGRSGRIRKRPVPVARKILLQLAVRDIGQLTDLS